MPRPKAVTPADDADCYSVDEFCKRHRISRQTFYKYRDKMPKTIEIGTRVLISKEAAADWRRAQTRALQS